MLVRICLELPLPLDCQVNLAIGHFSLLDYSVSEDGSHSPVEEVEYAAVNSTNAGPQFVYAIAKVVCLWSAKLVAQLAESLNSESNLILCVLREAEQPRHKRCRAALFGVDHDSSSWHPLSTVFASLRIVKRGCQTRSGNRAQAQKILDEMTQRAKRGYFPTWAMASVYVGLGDKDRAFEWLQEAVEERAAYVPYLKVDPLFDPLRSDPRFTDLLRRMNLAP